MTPFDDPEMAGSTLAGWIGAAIAGLGAMALGLRQWLSSAAAARAENSANVEFISTIMNQLERANERADKFAKERNEAVEEIGELKAQIAALRMTVEHMQNQLNQLVKPYTLSTSPLTLDEHVEHDEVEET